MFAHPQNIVHYADTKRRRISHAEMKSVVVRGFKINDSGWVVELEMLSSPACLLAAAAFSHHRESK
jgi:hypothetical protein